MENFLKTLAEVSAPLALAGLLSSFLFYAVRGIIKAKLIPAVSKKHALTVILAIINKLFILSLVALVLGIAAYASERLLLPGRVRADGVAVKVYYFEHYGGGEEDQTGERFSGLILDNLLRRNLNAKRSPHYYTPTRGGNYDYLQDELNKLGPFISITGYLEGSTNGSFLAHVRVVGVDAKLQVKPLMVEEFEVPQDRAAMRIKAAEISEVIYRVIESFTANSP